MNPGPVEEAGGVARTLITNLKEQPLTLALIIFNAAFVVTVYYGVQDQREHQQELFKILLNNQAKTQEMLYQCVPQQRTTLEELEQ